MKNTTHDCTVPVSEQSYKKSYLLRKQQEREALIDIKTTIKAQSEQVSCLPILDDAIKSKEISS